ncbi:MAG: efflux RND transporter permease subunit, partial [Actinomycetota bacterium]|nr:efflux RND transporter permease subunit [Actinomycetota bacterium]
LWVSIDPDADYDATVDSIREVVNGYPGLSGDVQTYSNERVREALTVADEDVVVRVFGEELEILRGQGEAVRQALSKIDGIADAQVLTQAEEPTLEVQVDLDAAQQHGIKPGDVRRAAAALLSGIQVGSLFEQQKVFDVVVWGQPETRNSLSSVRQLLIDTPTGGHVRLEDVAEVRIAPNQTIINREAVSRYLDVGASVSGRDRDSVLSDVESTLEGMAFPLEYHAEVLASDTQPVGLLISIGVAAAIGIFLLLQAAFGSWRLATLSFSTLPVAVAGGVLAALAAGGTLSLGSLLGLVAVLGIAARNGILLIDHFRQLEEHEGETFGPGLVLRGASERLVPISMAALATALALVPLVILGGIPGYEIVRPMAIVILGGLVTSTLLNLFVVPALYLRVGVTRVDPVTRQLDA